MDSKRCMKGLCKTCPENLTCNGIEKYRERVVIDYKLDNWNDTIYINRKNKYAANNKKQKEMSIIRNFLIGIKPIRKYPVRLECIWHVVNLGSDLDNKSLKSVLDEMQNKGILENDNSKHIQEITHKVMKDKKDYLELYIEEI